MPMKVPRWELKLALPDGRTVVMVATTARGYRNVYRAYREIFGYDVYRAIRSSQS